MSIFGGGQAPKIPIPDTALAGPADADNFRVKVGYERWYTDPLPGDDIAPALEPNAAGDYPAWPSISGVKKASGSDWTFVANNRYAKAIEAAPQMFVGNDSGEIVSKLSNINKRDMSAAQNRGTNVHSYAEMVLRGKALQPRHPGEPGVEYLPAVRAFFDAYRPRLIAAEVVCLHRSLHGYGYGGTADAFVELIDPPNGLPSGIYVVDWKSRGPGSNHGAYAEEAAQIGGYANAEYMIVEGEHGPVRELLPQFVGGLIISIRPDGFKVYPVDLDDAFEHFTNMHAWWVARRTEKKAIKRVLPGVKVAPLADRISSAPTIDELTALWRLHCMTWDDDLTTLAERRAQVLHHG